jgi:ribonuclease HI
VIPINGIRSPVEPSYINTQFVLHFDGCSKGNPGPAGAGAVIYKNNEEYWSSCYTIGKHFTNNYAEYCGLIMGLRGAISHNINNILVKGDSMLVIKQMKGEYKVQSDLLKQLNSEALELTKRFSCIDFEHVYRDKNTRADELANFGLVECMKNTKQSTSSRIFE